jgi:hypothetical protein
MVYLRPTALVLCQEMISLKRRRKALGPRAPTIASMTDHERQALLLTIAEQTKDIPAIRHPQLQMEQEVKRIVSMSNCF